MRTSLGALGVGLADEDTAEEARRATVALARRAGLGKTRSAAAALLVRSLADRLLSTGSDAVLFVVPALGSDDLEIAVDVPRGFVADLGVADLLVASSEQRDLSAERQALLLRPWPAIASDGPGLAESVLALAVPPRRPTRVLAATSGGDPVQRRLLVDAGDAGSAEAVARVIELFEREAHVELPRLARLVEAELESEGQAGWVLVELDAARGVRVLDGCGPDCAVSPAAWWAVPGQRLAPGPQDGILRPWGEGRLLLAAGFDADEIGRARVIDDPQAATTLSCVAVCERIGRPSDAGGLLMMAGPGQAVEPKVHALLTVPLRRARDVTIAAERAQAVVASLGAARADEAAFSAAMQRMASGALERMGRTDVDIALRAGSDTLELVAIAADLAVDVDVDVDGWSGPGRRFAMLPTTDATAVALIGLSVARDGLDVGSAQAGAARAGLAATQTEIDAAPRTRAELARALRDLHVAQRGLVRSRRELEDARAAVARLSTDLASAEADIRLSDRERARVLATLAHELRTPLFAIQGLVEVLTEISEEPLSEQQRADVDAIGETTASALGLIEEHLVVARDLAGGSLRLEDVSVESLFASLRGMLDALPRSAEVELDFVAPGPLVLRTDAGKLTQILRNFISNALKFTDRGRVAVSARATPDGIVTFEVSDTGIGLSEEDAKRVFDEFVQVDGAHDRSRMGVGTGLGLTISRRLAHALGAEVGVRSTPGEGSTFTLALPGAI